MAKKLDLLVIATIVITVSCSGLKRPESISEKMARYQPKDTLNNNVPDLQVFQDSNIFKQQTKGANRGPASVTTSNDNSRSSDDDLSYSNKRLYFLTLLSEYKALSSFSLQKAPPINMCPNFHNSLLDYNEQHRMETTPVNTKFLRWETYSKMFMTTGPQELEKLVALYPELALPMKKESDRPRVADIIKKEESKKLFTSVIGEAIDLHLLKLHQELKELCEIGSSDNYFIFENLYTYIKQHQNFTSSPANLKILFKTTIFSNLAIIDSIEHATINSKNEAERSVASTASTKNKIFDDKYLLELVNRLDVPWSYAYLDNLVEIRSN